MQWIPRRGEPALREEFIGAGPVGRIALNGMGNEPDEEVMGGVCLSGGGGDGEAGFAGAGGGGGGEETEGFSDEGCGEGELVEEVGVLC